VFKKSFILLIVLQLVFLPLFAQESPEFETNHGPLRKLARGAINVAFGWLEIPRQMMRVKQEAGKTTGDIVGATWGPLKGIACSIGRTAIGALELVTFAIPEYDPIIEPEFIFSEEEE
jgi:putative exosortase-associated protein (TIGR04073 family)